MYRITRSFEFSAAHHIAGLPAGHPCGRPHGHTYRVVLVLESETLDAYGFVRDYGDLDPVADWIARELDHRDLNEVMAPVPTTAEHIARWIFEHVRDRLGIAELAAVRVSETPATLAEYRP